MENKRMLIDANALKFHYARMQYPDGTSSNGYHAFVTSVEVKDAPTVDAIPIAVIKRAIAGINAADQCDQAGRHEFELRNALKTVLKWYNTPAYEECERRTE